MALVGLLTGVDLDDQRIGEIRQSLKDTGYVEGRNVQSNIARRVVASIDCRHWPPSWWLTL
jgi:hypothetical protein